MRVWRVILPLIALALAFLAGVQAHRSGAIGDVAALLSPEPGASSPLSTSPYWRDPFVLIAVGQSNAANHGRPRGRSGVGTYAIAVSGLYPMEDPLPGASGLGGSPWTRWAALRRLANPSSEVVVGAIAEGSSRVTDWIGGGAHANRLPRLVAELRRQGLEVNSVVWHQGETEAWSGADANAYAADLLRWISSVRQLGITAPIFVCLTSRDSEGVVNPAIRGAQASMWDRSRKVFAGVDTDSLGSKYRSDGVHFNERGLEAFATLMQQAMDAPSDKHAVALRDLGGQ